MSALSLDTILEAPSDLEDELDLDLASLQALSCAAPVPPQRAATPDAGRVLGASEGRRRARREGSDESGSSTSPRLDDGGDGEEEHRTREAHRALFSEAKTLYHSGLSLSSSNPYAATLHFRQAASVFAEVPGQRKRVEKCLWQAGMAWAGIGVRAARRRGKGEGARGREEAREAFEEARALFSFVGETKKEAMALYHLGCVTDEILLAAEHIKAAATLFADLGDESHEAMCYAEAAHLFGNDDPDTAIFFLKQCLLLYMKLGDTNREGKALFAIGSLAAHLDRQTAHNYYLQARVIFRRRGDSIEDANCSYQLGKMAATCKSYEAAVLYFEERGEIAQASALFHDAGKSVDEAWALYRLALVMLKVKTAELALDYLNEAKKLFAEAGNEKAAEGSCLMRMGEILSTDNESTNGPLAEALLQEALELVDPKHERIGRRSTVCLRKLEDRKSRASKRKERAGRRAGAGGAAQVEAEGKEGRLEKVAEEEEEPEGEEDGGAGRQGTEGGEAWWAM
ncbi:hypothetical protein JCM6882_008646 [Rhodosporidiobolus microsporus]